MEVQPVEQPVEQEGGYVVVWDCESDSGFEAVAGYTREEKVSKIMQFTCICTLTLPSTRVLAGESADELLAGAARRTFWRDEAERGGTPVDEMLRHFDGADAIVGYNVLSFDFPLIQRFYRPRGAHTALARYTMHRCKTLDVMARVRDATSVYYKLDTLLQRNGLEKKSGSGKDAIALWQDDKRDELQAYCAKDVEQTARLALCNQLILNDATTLPHYAFGLRATLLCLSHKTADAVPIATAPPSVATRLVLKPLIGRLGNQIFQWASAYGIAAKHNASLCLSGAQGLVATFVGPFHECGAWHAALTPCSLTAITGAPCVRQYLEQGPHRFDDLPVDCAYVRFPHSFLESFRYFAHVESAVRRRLRFQPHLKAAARVIVARSPCVRANPHAVLAGVHVRRTDRAHQQRVPDAAFFAKAIAHLRAQRAARGVCFVVASDDVDWCRAQRVFAAADVHLINESQPGVALATLARCDDHVVSVGTFGWWGAWLGRGTVVHFAEEDIGQNSFRPPRRWAKKQYEQAGVAAPALVPMGVPRDYFPQDWVAL